MGKKAGFTLQESPLRADEWWAASSKPTAPHQFGHRERLRHRAAQGLGALPDYEPAPDTTVEAIARARGLAPEAVALDHMLADGGRGMLYVPFLNYAEGSLDAAHAMITHPLSVPGLSDGGAHVGMICDGSFPTTMITHWTRDRTRGPKLGLAEVIRM